MQTLRERYVALGEIAVEFLEGLLTRTRYSKLTDSKPIPPRHSQEYQDLLYGKPAA